VFDVQDFDEFANDQFGFAQAQGAHDAASVLEVADVAAQQLVDELEMEFALCVADQVFDVLPVLRSRVHDLAREQVLRAERGHDVPVALDFGMQVLDAVSFDEQARALDAPEVVIGVLDVTVHELRIVSHDHGIDVVLVTPVDPGVELYGPTTREHPGAFFGFIVSLRYGFDQLDQVLGRSSHTTEERGHEHESQTDHSLTVVSGTRTAAFEHLRADQICEFLGVSAFALLIHEEHEHLDAVGVLGSALAYQLVSQVVLIGVSDLGQASLDLAQISDADTFARDDLLNDLEQLIQD